MDDRRHFTLPEKDRCYLSRSGLRWETLKDSNDQWVILYGVAIPAGYNQNMVDIAIKIEPNYPDGQLDMAYFSPAVTRVDNKTIPNADSNTAFDGRNWQRWSRHRTPENPWQPGEDCLETHMNLVHDWLKREFERRP